MTDTRSSREPLIIHHVGCADGICGALVLWLAGIIAAFFVHTG